MDFQVILNQIQQEFADLPLSGKVASYIPELATVPPGKFGMHLYNMQGENFCFGDSNERFSIQSISKVFSLSLAMKVIGEDLREPWSLPMSSSPRSAIPRLHCWLSFTRSRVMLP